MRKSFLIQSTAKPKSNLSSTMVLPRFSICQDCAAPFEITSSTSFASRPALMATLGPSDRPCTRPAMQIWLTILVSWPEPEGPISVTALAKWAMTALARSNAAGSPPTMTVSCPFSAPAWPPDTGASRNSKPRFLASTASSRATFAEAVVWSTKTVPLAIFWKAPFGPSVTSRRSGSSPTQENTISASSAAFAGVSAKRPLCLEVHASALARLRLYTVTSCPPRATRCPAIGNPITPRPMNSILLTAPPVTRCLAKKARFTDNYKVLTRFLRPFPYMSKDLTNAIRALAMDAVQAANSGHPGMPMGMAEIALALWGKHLRHNPANPKWADRDRFVLSNGHGSMLLYALLHLTGYDLPIDELRRFR